MQRIFFFLALLITAITTHAQTADEIINKHLAAIGGADNWRKITSIKSEGELSVMGNTVSVIETVAHGKGNRQDIAVMGMNGFVIIAPTSGWSFLPFQGLVALEAMKAEMVAASQEKLDAQGTLVDYAAKGHNVEYLGKENLEGVECYKLKINFKSGTTETLLFDVKTYFLLQAVTKQKENGEETKTSYSNYKKLPEGITVPMTINVAAGELHITTVTINAPVDESIFKN